MTETFAPSRARKATRARAAVYRASLGQKTKVKPASVIAIQRAAKALRKGGIFSELVLMVDAESFAKLVEDVAGYGSSYLANEHTVCILTAGGVVRVMPGVLG